MINYFRCKSPLKAVVVLELYLCYCKCICYVYLFTLKHHLLTITFLEKCNYQLLLHEMAAIHFNYDLMLEALDIMIFKATFNIISVKSYRSVLLVEESGAPWKPHRLAASHRQTLSHNVVSSPHHIERNSKSQLYWW